MYFTNTPWYKQDLITCTPRDSLLVRWISACKCRPLKELLPQTKIYFWEFHFWFNVKILYSKIIGMRFWECFFDRCLFSLQNLILIIHFIFCFCSTPHVRYRNFRVGVFFFYIYRFEVAITCRHFCIDKSKIWDDFLKLMTR